MKGEPIDEVLIGQKVAALGLDWLYRAETGSTNADVLDHYGENRREVVAFSESQSAGRGRRGREWHSPSARNIYCTIGLQKVLPAKHQGLLSIVTGLAICRTLRQQAGAAVRLKWPNDLLAEGRKFGGILIESRAHDRDSFFFAIGFGLNLFMHEDELALIAQHATSLDRVVAGPLDRGHLLGALIDAVVAEIRAFDSSQAQSLAEEYAEFDAFHEREVEVISGQQRIRGVNRGIAASGQLQLETEQGLKLYSAAEISLRAGDE